MDVELELLARNFYGYGRWDAPYWFIGPEPGGGGNAERASAWINKFNRAELCDCKDFHREIDEKRWHRATRKPQLQPTFRPLILLLKTFLNETSDREAIRNYQRDHWGMIGGKTCVIELSGLAAKKKDPKKPAPFLKERIDHICEMRRRHEPTFVVMYGVAEKEHWEKIAGCPLCPDVVVKRESTMFMFTSHPMAFGKKNSDWEELGRKLRQASGSL